MIAGSQTIADDRRRSQTIAEDRTWFYLLRSSAITIADDRRSVFPYDRRRSQNFLRSAIRDCLRSYGNQPLAEQTNYLFYCEPNLSDTTLWCFSGQVSKVLTFSSETVLLRISLKRTIRFHYVKFHNLYLPTMFLCGPVSTEFQFHATLEFQFVNPSWCLLVNTKYLKDKGD